MFNSLHPSPLIIDFGFAAVHWYGFLIAFAVAISFFLSAKLFKKYHLSPDVRYDVFFCGLIGGAIGARLWHVFSEWNYYFHRPLEIFQIWHGGLAIHGAIIGGIIALYFIAAKLNHPLKQQSGNETMKHWGHTSAQPDSHIIIEQYNNIAMPARRIGGKQWSNEKIAPPHNISPAPPLFSSQPIFFLLLDILAPFLALGQSIGRLGNYFNQELYGQPIGWGIPIDFINRLPGYENFQYFHPLFLYESLWCLIIFGLLIYLHSVRFNISALNRKQRIVILSYGYIVRIVKAAGAIFFTYLILYSLGRFFIGFLRIDSQAAWLNLRLDQWVSLVFLLTGIIYFVHGWLYCKNKAAGDKNF